MMEHLFRMNLFLVKYLLTGQVIQPSVSNVIISYGLSGFNSELYYFHILVQFKISLFQYLTITLHKHQLAEPLLRCTENTEAHFLTPQIQLLDATGMNLKRDYPEIM